MHFQWAIYGNVYGDNSRLVNYLVLLSFSTSIRGQLGTFYMYARNVGILFAYILGSYYNYITSSMVFTSVTVLFFVIFWFIPSTPQYYLRKNNINVRFNFEFLQV